MPAAGWQAQWNGSPLALPQGCGELRLEAIGPASTQATHAPLDPPLTVRFRHGGERIKPAGDPHTRAILLYVESITAARKFMSAGRAAARNKPVIVVKAGRFPEAVKASAAHTGALAGSDAHRSTTPIVLMTDIPGAQC